MDPHKIEDRMALITSVEHSRKEWETVLESRRKLLKRSAGSEWYEHGSDEDTPLNQMAQQEETLVHHLIGGDPQALVIGASPGLEATAADQMLALNKEAERVGFRRKLRRLVRDAIYGIGIARVGMVHDHDMPVREIAPELDEEEGVVGIGRLEINVISPEAWVHDCLADTLEEIEYCGHAYWVKEEDLKHYLPNVSPKDLGEGDEKTWIDEQGYEMAGAISRGSGGNKEAQYEGRYRLWDLYLPRQKMMITTPVGGTGEHAYVREWTSRPGGPYLYLYYRELPDQAIPVAVQADLALVHDAINSTFRKLIEDIREQKTILGYMPGHEGDAENIRDSGRRGIVQMRDPNAVKEFSFNGPTQELLASLPFLRDFASIIGGNTDAIAGLGPQAATLGQEEMVRGQAGVKIRAHELDTAGFVVELFEAMRWYIYHEQIEPVRFVKESRATGARIPGDFDALRARERPGSYDAFSLKIEPDSLKYKDSEQRYREIMQVWNEVVLPGLQLGLLQQAPDMDVLLDLVAKYRNLPEIRSFLRPISTEEQEAREGAGGGGGEPRQSPVTTRHQVRHGAPGPTNHGMAMQMMQNLGRKQE